MFLPISDIYLKLQNCEHPYLPKLYEVSIADDSTTVIEEYIEGESLGEAELAEKQQITEKRCNYDFCTQICGSYNVFL